MAQVVHPDIHLENRAEVLCTDDQEVIGALIKAPKFFFAVLCANGYG